MSGVYTTKIKLFTIVFFFLFVGNCFAENTNEKIPQLNFNATKVMNKMPNTSGKNSGSRVSSGPTEEEARKIVGKRYDLFVDYEKKNISELENLGQELVADVNTTMQKAFNNNPKLKTMQNKIMQTIEKAKIENNKQSALKKSNKYTEKLFPALEKIDPEIELKIAKVKIIDKVISYKQVQKILEAEKEKGVSMIIESERNGKNSSCE